MPFPDANNSNQNKSRKSRIQFGQSTEPRNLFNQTLLDVSNRVHQISDTNTRNFFLYQLRTIARIESATDQQYKRWTQLLVEQLNNHLSGLQQCVETIRMESTS